MTRRGVFMSMQHRLTVLACAGSLLGFSGGVLALAERTTWTRATADGSWSLVRCLLRQECIKAVPEVGKEFIVYLCLSYIDLFLYESSS